MSYVAAIDPGSKDSALLLWNGSQITDAVIVPNEDVSWRLRHWAEVEFADLYIETIRGYGLKVGNETFDTCIWVGRFFEMWKQRRHKEPVLVARKDVLRHHCNTGTANDTFLRQALIERFGPPGTTKQKGFTFGLKSHLWSAFGVATYALDTHSGTRI